MSLNFSREEAPWLCNQGASLLSLPNDVLLRISAAARPEDAFRLSVCNSRLHGLMNEDYWQLRAQSMGAEIAGSATAVCQLFGVIQGFCASCATPVLVPWEDLSPRGLPALEGRQQGLFPNAVSHWILKLWFCPACISNPCFFYVSEAHLSIWHLETADLAGLPSKLVDGSLWYRYHDVVQRKSIKTSFLTYGHGGGDHTLVPMGLDHSFLQAANFNFTLQNRLTAEALSMQLLAALAKGEQHLPIGPPAPANANGSGTGDQTRVVPPGCANSNILPPELFPQYAQAHLLAQPWHYKDLPSTAQATPASSMMPVALATLDTPRSRAGSLASRPPHFFIHNGSPSEEHVWRHTHPLQSAGAATLDDPRSIAGSSARPLTASTSASTSRQGITATPETGIMSLAHGDSDERKPGPSRSAASPSDGDGSPEPQQKKRRRPPAKTPEEKAAREREKEEAKRLRAEEREREKQRKAFEREIEKQRKAAEREKEAKRKALEKHAQAVKAAAEGQDRPPAPKKSKTSTSSSSSKTSAPRPNGARGKATPTPKKATPGKRKVTECSTDSESQDQLAGPSSSIEPNVKVESQGIRLPVGTDDSAEGQEDGMSSALTTDDEDDDDDLAGRPRPDISHLIGMGDDEARRQIIRDVKREQLDDALKARGFQMVKNRTSPEIEAWVDYKWAELLPMGITCVEDVVQRLLDQFGPGAVRAASASQQRREQQAQLEAELPLTATQEGAAAATTAQHQGDSSESADRSFETFATANEHVTPRSRGASGNVMNLAALMHGCSTNGLGHAESSQNTRRNMTEADRLLHLANLGAPRQQQQQAHQRQPSLPQPQQHFSPTSYGSLQGLIDADNVYGAYMQQASDLSHSHQRRASVHSRSHSQQQIQLQQQQQHRRTPSITGGSALLFGAAGESSAAAVAASSSSNNMGGVQKGNAAALSPTISSQGRKSLIYGTEGNDAAADATAASLTDQFEADSLAFSSSLLAAEEAAARHERS